MSDSRALFGGGNADAHGKEGMSQRVQHHLNIDAGKIRLQEPRDSFFRFRQLSERTARMPRNSRSTGMRYLQALSSPLLSPALMIPPISTIAIRTYTPQCLRRWTM